MVPKPSTLTSKDPHLRIYHSYVSSGAADVDESGMDGLHSRVPYLRKLVRNYFPFNKSSKILDLGCGYGALLYVGAQEGFTNLTGVDLSIEQVEVAHKLGLTQVINADVLDFVGSAPTSAFDVVITFDFIEHLAKEDIITLIDHIHRILKDDGRWIIHVPNAESPFFGRILYGDFTHEIAFTQKSLSTLLRASGFSHVRCFEDAPVPHGLISAARLVMWKIIRSLLRLYIMAETGALGRECIFSQNILVVAQRSERSVGLIEEGRP
jgi:SAM-dependent methyltransferase